MTFNSVLFYLSILLEIVECPWDRVVVNYPFTLINLVKPSWTLPDVWTLSLQRYRKCVFLVSTLFIDKEIYSLYFCFQASTFFNHSNCQALVHYRVMHILVNSAEHNRHLVTKLKMPLSILLGITFFELNATARKLYFHNWFF